MASLKRALLNYAEFLKESGYLYVESPEGEAEAPMPATSGLMASRMPTPLSSQISPSGSARVAAPVTPAPMAVPATAAATRTQPAPQRATPAPAPPRAQDIVQIASSRDALRGESLGEADRIARLAEGAGRAEACRACVLGKTRKQAVYGTGSPMARIVFVGEAPGAEEDEHGKPFIGAAGKLLTKMIEAIGFTRHEVYICNTLNCRPPGNRPPAPDEKKACEHFLHEQIEILRPSIIVGLGAHAAGFLTGETVGIGKLRRRWFQFRGITAMMTYHPSYLLRSPGQKGQSWEDFQMLHARYSEMHPDDPHKIWSKEG